MPFFLNQGKAKVRDAIKTKFTHVGVSTDQTAFAVTQTRLDPTGTATNLIKTATAVNQTVSTTDDAVDLTMTINGASEFTNQTIWTVGVLDSSMATACAGRYKRTAGIGVENVDTFTIGVRVQVQDNTP